MKRIRYLIVAMAAIAMGSILALMPIQAASAHPSSALSTPSSDDHSQPNMHLPRKVGEYSIPLKLTPVDGATPGGGATTDGNYPTGCGLYVYLYRVDSTMYGTMTTSCNFVVSSIDHNIYIYRSRWFGWERLVTHEGDYSYGVTSKGTTVDYYCGGKGTYDYRVEGYGYVSVGGGNYWASAYDQMNSVSC
jgi:hypothetical protein